MTYIWAPASWGKVISRSTAAYENIASTHPGTPADFYSTDIVSFVWSPLLVIA